MTETEIKEAADWYSDQIATFGDRLAGAREALVLSQADLAARVGVNLATILDWENDLNDPRSNTLQTLSGVLGVSIPWLLTGAGDGLDAPVTAAAGDAETVLDDMREVRGKITALTTELGVLEGRLRATLRA